MRMHSLYTNMLINVYVTVHTIMRDENINSLVPIEPIAVPNSSRVSFAKGFL